MKDAQDSETEEGNRFKRWREQETQKFTSLIAALDNMVTEGYYPQEMEQEVERVGRAAAREFSGYLAIRGLRIERKGLEEFLLHFFVYVYIESYVRRRSKLRNINRPLLHEYLLPSLNAAAQLPMQSVIGCAQVLLLFFHFATEAGYQMNAERAARALNKIEQEVYRKLAASASLTKGSSKRNRSGELGKRKFDA